jgi:hypothetical protein
MFIIAAGPRQRSQSHAWVPRDSLPYFTFSDSTLPQPGGTIPRIYKYIPQEQGGPVITPGTGFPLRRLLRLAGLRWRYLTPPQHRFTWKVEPSRVELSLMLRSTVSRPVCLGIKHPSGAYDQIFITVWHMQDCWCEALSLTRGRVWCLQLLLVLASAVIFWSESHGTRPYFTVSDLRLPFSSPPITRRVTVEVFDPAFTRVQLGS